MFNPNLVEKFRFVSYEFDENTFIAKLNYAFDDNYFFTEQIAFNNANTVFDDEKRKALDLCLKNLHLVAGSSYYKAAIPPKIVIENQEITKETSDFMQKLYLNGLGEFAYRNNLDLKEKLIFPYSDKSQAEPSNISLKRRTAVTVGGGKDSIVTIELLKKKNEDIILFSVGNPKAIKQTVEVSELPHITVTRTLSPVLFELNAQGAYNGHVPISGIIAFILACSSIIYGFDSVAMSNERSANVGNLIRDGLEINHQYSKGLEFETDVSNYFQSHIMKNFNYFSFLRPLSELGIAKIFSKFEKYHSVFTSCNAAFKIQQDKRVDRWCLNCDKCRFVFLAIAPFLSKEKMLNIFGKNLLNDETQIKGFEELIGISGHKPFECVGEVEECNASFGLLNKQDEWKDDIMVKIFREKALPQISNLDEIITKTFNLSDKHRLNTDYFKLLSENSNF
ncbi:MAG: endonuclease domain-containing protein [Candidatus Sericytochromatia bacterium]